MYADKALEIDPVNTNALIVKGFSLGISGNHTEAIKYFDLALENDPKNVDVLYGKRVILNELDNRTRY
jgi:tetratricopeptide (TPR) repeat protein